MKHLTKFETQAAYETAESGLILPNVSLVTEGNIVHYNPLSPTPPTPSHDYVEIGGIKWATMNVGATSITDYGLYFQWGDTQGYTAAQVGGGEGKKAFTWADYKYTNDGGSTMSKYNSTDGKTTLDAEDDAVTAALGGNWRMPTVQEIQSLSTATTSAWTADYQGSGVAGFILTSNEDSSNVLFFPAAGFCANSYVHYVGSYGNYWTSSRDAYEVSYAYSKRFENNIVGSRVNGYPVRGVLDA